MPLPCYPSLFGWKYYRTHTGDVSSIHQSVIIMLQKSTVMNKSKHVYIELYRLFLSHSTTGFAPEQSETDFLKRRLKEERAKVAKAERARREAEARCLSAERERAVYRLLARRWQSRLNALLSQQQQQDHDEQGESNAVHHQHRAAEDLLDLLDSGTGNNNNNNNAVLFRVGDRSTLAAGLRAMIQEQLNDVGNNDNEEDGVDSEDDDEDEGGAIDMDEDHSEDGRSEEEEDSAEEEEESDDAEEAIDNEEEEEDLLEYLADENESIMSSRDRNNSVVMEDVEDLVLTSGGQRSADQPRTVSVSSYDL